MGKFRFIGSFVSSKIREVKRDLLLRNKQNEIYN